MSECSHRTRRKNRFIILIIISLFLEAGQGEATGGCLLTKGHETGLAGGARTMRVSDAVDAQRTDTQQDTID